MKQALMVMILLLLLPFQGIAAEKERTDQDVSQYCCLKVGGKCHSFYNIATKEGGRREIAPGVFLVVVDWKQGLFNLENRSYITFLHEGVCCPTDDGTFVCSRK